MIITFFKNHGQNTFSNSAFMVFGRTECVQKRSVGMAKDLETRLDVKRELQWFSLEKEDQRMCCGRRAGHRSGEPGSQMKTQRVRFQLTARKDFLMPKLLRAWRAVLSA